MEHVCDEAVQWSSVGQDLMLSSLCFDDFHIFSAEGYTLPKQSNYAVILITNSPQSNPPWNCRKRKSSHLENIS